MADAPDFHIYQEIMLDYSRFNGKECQMYRYFNRPYPQRLSDLSGLLATCTLREHGDIKKYLQLQKELIDLCPEQITPTHKNIYNTMDWLNNSIDALNPEEADVVICLMAYGEAYTKRLLEYAFCSFMSFENLPCLAVEKKVTILVITDSKYHEVIGCADITNKIRALGVHFDYAVMPDGITEEKEPYWLLGAAASLGFQYAKKAGAAFHMSYPDIIYSNKYFSELLRLSKEHKAILVPGMRADETMIQTFLPNYVDSHGTISVPCADLVAIHLNCLHKSAWGLLVNNRPRDWTFPNFHVILWEGNDFLRIDSPHLDPVWLDNSIIQTIEPRYFMTIDSEMDLIVKGEDYYIPTETDSLYRAEISAPERDGLTDNYASIQDVAYTMWASIVRRDCFKFFVRGMKLPINREIRPAPENVMPNEAVKALRNFLINTILAADPLRGTVKRTHDNYIML